ncbi:DUF4124 domain-containing protein [Dyella sedimenti]|uniref:DUF4124 domain-containing protein n=1 Tax=Dyella sedimenti TaxID=2919947 RepID=UPI001FA9C19F|nr:DUF4124 domain-containing protein [Dyella sedimenti]
MRRLLIATTLLLAAPLVAAQAYKWTDANGTVHYADTPPPQGTKYNKVTTTGTVEPLAAPATSTANTEGAAAAPKPSQPAAPVADTPENRAKLCSTLKNNLDVLKGSGPVVMEQDGQQKVMDANQRQQQQTSAQAQYQQFCAGN